MTDVIEWIEIANRVCPLQIERSKWQDPILSLGGNNWSFSATAPWRVVRGNTIIAGVYDDNASTFADAWLGERIVKFLVLPGSPQLDIAAILSNGDMLQIFCTSTHENWVLRVPGEPTMVFVPDS